MMSASCSVCCALISTRLQVFVHNWLSRIFVTRSLSFEVAQTVLILTRSASEANKLRLPFRVKCLPRWRFGLVFFAVVSLPVTTVGQKCATSKSVSEGFSGNSLAYASSYHSLGFTKKLGAGWLLRPWRLLRRKGIQNSLGVREFVDRFVEPQLCPDTAQLIAEDRDVWS